MSIFADSLKSLLDDTNLFDRSEWGEFLFIKVINGPPGLSNEEKIERWLCDEAIPKPYDLNMIVTALENSSDVKKEPLEAFKQMALRPAREVSEKFGRLMLPTVWEYMKRPIFSELSSKLARLNTDEEKAKLLEELYTHDT